MLEAEIRKRRANKDILLMTHIVLGYPSMEASRKIAHQMVEAGVDLMELQIPFSEPIADGPVILHANQRALAAGATVDGCFQLAQELARELPIPFLFMSYYNIAWKRGLARFAAQTHEAGLRGAIIPDLPFEEGDALLSTFEKQKLDPIFIFSPNTPEARMHAIAERARGFVYCVARKGVTGSQTEFAELGDYLARCRRATKLPLALGFGVKSREDVAAITGQVDIAVVGSETIRVVDQHGVDAVPGFIRGLR
ncbi:MAG TPA: tryptophan synthase subunit alpha [Polyangiales bacterium]|nr:tryptophan synthase subunit alpha [Polyangiales bacterium]